jgi:light-regulated signal transduction histidine kinase (bacteriophytochrome)
VAQATQDLALAIGASSATVAIGPLPVVRGNQIHLVRLFQNLISNAVKYRGKKPAEIQVTGEQNGRDWVIGVKDNGLGIAPEHHACVFTPFMRLADRNIPGSGLGLAVCRKLVEEWGGRIWIESELGAGSTFRFTITADESGALGPVVAERKDC